MRRSFICLFILHVAASTHAAEPDARGVEFFERKIRPVLVKHCYACHSPQAKKVQGGLLLDTRAGIRKGGDSGSAVVPNDAKESVLLNALRYEDFEMPPKGKLPDAVIADFEKWIKMGAPDPRDGKAAVRRGEIDFAAARKFWSFQPPKITDPPAVKNTAWPRGEIDRHLLARLEVAGLEPAPDADRRTLIRRVYFDLVGLPPKPEEIEAFLNDRSDDALAKVIDRLLASRHFGERWGRHWLDVARYSDSTGGGRTKIYGNSWRYRDYVIDSLNGDKPYDEFIAEQIAGDLLPSKDLDQQRQRLTALAFLVLGPHNYELQDKELLRMEVVDEQIDTLGRAVLGMTIGCARCHDHKFDPIPTTDYYALAGIFRSTKSLLPGNVSEYVERPLPLPPDEQRALDEHAKAMEKAEGSLKVAKIEMNKIKTQLGQPLGKVDLGSLPGIVVDDRKAMIVGQWMGSASVQGFLGEGYIHDGATADGKKSVTFTPKLPKAGEYEVRLSYTPATNRAAKAPVTVHSAEGEKTVHVDQRKRPPIDGVFVSIGRFRFDQGEAGRVVISNKDAGGHVIADAVQFLPLDGAKTPAAEKKQPDPRLRKQLTEAQSAVKQLEATVKKLKQQGPKPPPRVLAVVDEPQTGDYFVCIRGTVRNLGPKVPRGFLTVAHAGGTPQISPGQSGRLELARWLTGRENPLTARVMVNRIWHHLFGEGIVRTPDNFGHMGERPSHPRLLDYLAVRFMEQGWSVKATIRQIMLSRAYQLSSQPRPAVIEVAGRVDPENRLLSHANRRRLDAEAIRDAILTFSGQLDPTPGGPTIRPGTTTEFGYRFTTLRRGVYVPVFRNRLHGLAEVFDFPDPNIVTGRRNTSTLATQALYLMNSPFVMTQARHAATRLLAAQHLDTAARIDLAYHRALGRPPRAGERELALKFIAASKDDPTATWTGLCQSLMACLDFRYVD